MKLATLPSIKTPAQYDFAFASRRATLPSLLSLRRQLQVPFKMHPSGFIACTLITEGVHRIRLHYWPTLGGVQQSPNCQIHDHLFTFKSWVLAGAVQNIEYITADKGKEFAAYRTEYAGDQSVLTKVSTTVRLAEQRRTIHCAGSCYSMSAGILHETARFGTALAFTVLLTNDITSTAPRVFGPCDGPQKYVYQRKALDDQTDEEMLTALPISI